MSDIILRLGIVVTIWAVLTCLFNPFLENEFWKRVSIALFVVGTLLLVLGWR